MSEIDTEPNDQISFRASLLITSSSSAKYGRIWRRFLFVRFVLSLRKTTSGQVSSSLPYAPLETVVDFNSDDEQTILNIVKEKDSCLLRRNGGVEWVASVLRSNLETGIPREHGLQLGNTYPIHSTRFLFNFLEACNSFTILLLLISAALSFAVEIMEQGPQYGWHDGVAILVAVFLLVIFRSVSNFRLQRELEKKQQKMQNLPVAVVRNGKHRRVAVSDLVRGDLMHLKEGDTIPADGLFVNGDNLVLDDLPNSKTDRHENPFLYYGSKVTKGRGYMLVVSEGAKPEPEKKNFLAAQIEQPNSYIDNLALLVSVLIALVVLIGLLCRRQHKHDDILPELKGKVTIDKLMKIFEDMFWRSTGRVHILAGSLTAIVIGMQHGMPLAITVSLSFWNGKVEKLCRAKPQTLPACGCMGLVTVICVNATGGLICNQMEEVVEFFIGNEDMLQSVDSESNQIVFEALRQGIGLSALVPEISVTPKMDSAVAAWANLRWHIDMEMSDNCFSVVAHGELGTNTNCSRVVMKKNEDDDEILLMHLKGDALTILNLCSHYYNRMGEIHAIRDERRNFEEVVVNMEKRGLKALAFACKQVDTPQSSEEGSHLLAVVGLKHSSHKTIQDLRNAGIRIILVSQDEISRAREVACELEILPPGSNYVEFEGRQIRNLTPPERMERIEEAILIGSCSTEDMLLVVKSLQEKGHVVAFFGGLTTRETQALKEADLGITKETQSTEMTRKSSDIVVSDEHSLVQVTKFGRCAYNNVQKFIQLQLTACISGLLINLIAAICLWDSPLTAIQLIWMYFITCLLGGLVMVMELRSENLMANPPAKRTRPLITKAIWKNIAAHVLFQTCPLIFLHLGGQAIPRMNEETWKVVAFNSFMLCHVLNQFNPMGVTSEETAKAALQHHWFFVALGCVIMTQVIVVEFGKSLAGLRRLNGVDWVLSLMIAALSWGVGIAVEFISVSLSTSYGWHHFGFSWRSTFSFASSLVNPLPIIFVFAFSFFFYPDDAFQTQF